MDRLLRQLQQFGIDAASPPSWTVIRKRAGDATPQLALAALARWRELLQCSHTLPVRLVEAACGADSGVLEFDTFCLELRRLLTLPRLPRAAAAGAAFCLTLTAKFHLECGHADCVWRGLYAFFFSRPLKHKSAGFVVAEFQSQLEWLSKSCEFDFAQQANLLTCWLAACHPTDWESTLLLVETFLKYHTYREESLSGFILGLSGLFNNARARASIDAGHTMSLQNAALRDCLAFWLRAVGASPTMPNPEQVLRAGVWVLETLEAERAQVSPKARPDFDDEQAWGFFTWAITALVRCLPSSGSCRDSIIAALSRYLEGFSARMALNAMARHSAPFHRAVSAAGGSPRRRDPFPTTHERGVSANELRSRSVPSWESLFEPPYASHFENLETDLAATPTLPPADIHLIPPALCEILSHSLNPDQWSEQIPACTAFLGGYELPHSGQPVIVLAYNTGHRVLWEVAGGDTLRSTERDNMWSATTLSGLSTWGLSQQDNCQNAWAAYEQWQKSVGKKESAEKALSALVRTLCSAFIGFHEQGLNPVYGPLIDTVVESVERQLDGESSLVNADLVFCPRGPLSMAAPALVGGRRRLARIFKSITVSPSLAVFSNLFERAGGRELIAFEQIRRPTLNVLAWCPENKGPARRLMKRAVEEFSTLTDLWLAAETPMTTLDRASHMTAAGDWSLVFAHGQAGPSGTGARLADGLFPIGLAPCGATTGAGVLFLLSCLAGRLAQTSPYVDAFGPITEEAVLTFCLSNRLQRPPTLVGAFTQIVEGHMAVDLGVELVARRLRRPPDGPAWAGFARILNDLIREVVSSKIEHPGDADVMSFARLLEGPSSAVDLTEYVRVAAKNPMHFLGIYSCLHFRLTGCEPTFVPAQ